MDGAMVQWWCIEHDTIQDQQTHMIPAAEEKACVAFESPTCHIPWRRAGLRPGLLRLRRGVSGTGCPAASVRAVARPDAPLLLLLDVPHPFEFRRDDLFPTADVEEIPSC